MVFHRALLLLSCLASATSVGVSNDAGNSAFQAIDDAFQQEAYLNKQIEGSLRASQAFLTAAPEQSGVVVSTAAVGESLSDAKVSESDAELGLASQSSAINGASNPSQLVQVPTVVSAKPVQAHAHPARIGSTLNLASILQRVASGEGGTDITALRPGAGTGVADVVTFGAFTKAFFGADLKRNKFTMDTVIALSWKDPRVAELVPKGMDRVSMSGKAALKKIWMPEIVITNRDIRKMEVISSTVIITKTGEVSKIERAAVVCNNVYELDEYPFDTQIVAVKIASSKYMLDEVVIKPNEDKSSSGAKDSCTKGTPYELKSWRTYSFDETDGALQKSRGVLELSIKRKQDTYWESHLMPTFMLLAISWGVFYFPFTQPFITPRLALSILALLSFTNLVIKSGSVLPDGSPYNWNDILNQQIQAMMFCTIVLNIFSEFCKHKLSVDEFAEAINNEAKFLMPLLSIMVVSIIITAGAWKWLGLVTTGVMTKVLIGLVMGLYVSSKVAGLPSAQAAVKAKKAKTEAEEKSQKAQKDAQDTMKRNAAFGGAAAAGAAGGGDAGPAGDGGGGGDA